MLSLYHFDPYQETHDASFPLTDTDRVNLSFDFYEMFVNVLIKV